MSNSSLTPLQFALVVFSAALSIEPLRFIATFSTIVSSFIIAHVCLTTLIPAAATATPAPAAPARAPAPAPARTPTPAPARTPIRPRTPTPTSAPAPVLPPTPARTPSPPPDPTMEAKATDLLAVLKNANLSIDSKVASLTSIKSDIKQKNVPEGAIAPIFESLRLAISAQHSSLSSAGFSALGHLLKRLYIQEHHHAVSIHARQLYSLLLERLGDHKERVRAHASQAFTDLWPAAPQEVEHHVLEVALVGKNPRAKEMSMFWLSNVRRPSFPIRWSNQLTDAAGR